jgi:programmed cell death 6-interacting protein
VQQVSIARTATIYIDQLLTQRNVFSTLQTLGLPSSLEALVQPTGLPDSILAKAEEIQHEGGCEALNKMFENVVMLSTKNAAIIDEAINELGKEHDEDERLRRRFQLGNHRS